EFAGRPRGLLRDLGLAPATESMTSQLSPVKDRILVPLVPDARTAVFKRGIALDIQEVGAAQVRVALGIAGRDASRLDGCGDRRSQRVVRHEDLRRAIGKLAT